MAAVEPLFKPRSRLRPDWGYLAYRLRRSPLTMVGLLMIIGVLVAVLIVPLFLTTNPDKIDLTARLAAPSWQHWFGTDEVGRDIFTRVLYGGRISIGVGFFVVFVSAGSGVIIGALAGVVGRWVDTVVMRSWT